MDFAYSFYLGAIDFANSGVLWKMLMFTCVIFIFNRMWHSQKAKPDGVDWLQFLMDPTTQWFSVVRGAFVLVTVAVTIVYVAVCTRPTSTVGDVIGFTSVLVGAYIASQLGNKFAERTPGTTVVNNAAPPSQVTVNNASPGPVSPPEETP